MLEAIGIGGILIGTAIAWWQNRKAARAELSLRRALDAVPEKVANGLKAIVVATNTPEAKAALPQNWPMGVQYADVDGDAKSELLVQYPAGAHGSQLKVFAWRQGEFSEIGAFAVGTPAGFDIGDFDGDGRTEIKAEEVDWNAGQPYVTAPRIELLYRWNGSLFEEVSRRTKSD